MIRTPISDRQHTPERIVSYLIEYAYVLLSKEHHQKPHDILTEAIHICRTTNNVNPALHATAYYLLAEKERAIGEWELSIKYCTESIELYPTREAYKCRAKAHEEYYLIARGYSKYPEAEPFYDAFRADEQKIHETAPIPISYPPPPTLEA